LAFQNENTFQKLIDRFLEINTAAQRFELSRATPTRSGGVASAAAIGWGANQSQLNFLT